MSARNLGEAIEAARVKWNAEHVGLLDLVLEAQDELGEPGFTTTELTAAPLHSPVDVPDPLHEIAVLDEARLLENVRQKRLDFIKRYGANAQPTMPLKLRLAYDRFATRDFVAWDGSSLAFNLFDCCQELLDEYEIREEPGSVVLWVLKETRRPPGSESRVHPPERDPNRSRWVPVLDFRIGKDTPFIDFEEVELAHQELFKWCLEYARVRVNPCGELPLTEQRCGWMLPMDQWVASSGNPCAEVVL